MNTDNRSNKPSENNPADHFKTTNWNVWYLTLIILLLLQIIVFTVITNLFE